MRYLEANQSYVTQERVWAKAFTAGHLKEPDCEEGEQCWRGQMNIGEYNAFYLSRFLNSYYYTKINTYYESGMLWEAYRRAHRLQILLSYVDLPLQSTGELGTTAAIDYPKFRLAAALLDNQSVWSDSQERKSAFALINQLNDGLSEEPLDKTDLLPSSASFIRGINQLNDQCPTDAYLTFKSIINYNKSDTLRESASFLALRSIFSEGRGSDHLQEHRDEGKAVFIDESADSNEELESDLSPSKCSGATPITYTTSEWDRLRKMVRTKGLQTDIVEMQRIMGIVQ